MNNDERQIIMSDMSPEQHERYRQILSVALAKMRAANGRRMAFKEILADGIIAVPADLRPAVDAVCARDSMGPEVNEPARDFRLKRLERDEYVKLSDFKNHRPVALIFGSYT